MLKKQIGAGFLSLAMLSSVGLHNFAFADPDPTTDYNITVNDGDGDEYGNSTATFTSGVNQVIDNENSENNVDAVQPSSSASIKGWQTEEPEGYAVNVTWGDLVFVYDRGQLNPETGLLERATNVVGAESDNYSVKEETTVNCWYGHDGVNNRVAVENLSTGSIKCTPGLEVGNTHPNIQVWFYTEWSSHPGTGSTVYAAHEKRTLPTGTYQGCFCNVLKYDDQTSYNVHSAVLAAPQRDANGSISSSVDGKWWDYDNDENRGTRSQFYVMLRGTPDPTLTTDPTHLDTIGTITLTFAKN